jgi:hypothetical protein
MNAKNTFGLGCLKIKEFVLYAGNMNRKKIEE